jgi:hypothetical protein
VHDSVGQCLSKGQANFELLVFSALGLGYQAHDVLDQGLNRLDVPGD